MKLWIVWLLVAHRRLFCLRWFQQSTQISPAAPRMATGDSCHSSTPLGGSVWHSGIGCCACDWKVTLMPSCSYDRPCFLNCMSLSINDCKLEVSIIIIHHHYFGGPWTHNINLLVAAHRPPSWNIYHKKTSWSGRAVPTITAADILHVGL